jgi:hypothetical protein
LAIIILPTINGCVHPGMPLGRKHLRRSRDAPTGGIGHSKIE